MTRPLPRSLALAATFAAVVAVLAFAQTGSGPTVATTAPLPLVEPVFDPTPAGFVNRFATALNDRDLGALLESLDPEISVLYLPGVAGVENPTLDEVRATYRRYAILDATISIDDCQDGPAAEASVLDCTFTYNSNYSRAIGLSDPQMFMRFVIGPAGIDATYLSPFVVAAQEHAGG